MDLHTPTYPTKMVQEVEGGDQKREMMMWSAFRRQKKHVRMAEVATGGLFLWQHSNTYGSNSCQPNRFHFTLSCTFSRQMVSTSLTENSLPLFQKLYGISIMVLQYKLAHHLFCQWILRTVTYGHDMEKDTDNLLSLSVLYQFSLNAVLHIRPGPG